MSNRYRAVSDLLIMVVFVCAITTPLVFMLFADPAELSSMEKRRLVTKPAISGIGVMSGTYQRGFDDYFQDHFGLRPEILELARRYRERVFARSISDNVIIGADGWRFYDIDGSLYDYMGRYAPSAQRLSSWVTALENEVAWFDTLGVQYLHVPLPGKMTLYGRFLPDRIRRRAGTTRLAAFREHLDTSYAATDLDNHVVNARKVLAQRLDADQLYFKTDTHWNDLGAYLVYAETINAARRWFPDIPVVPESRLRRVANAKTGDIARASGMPAEYVERSFALEIIDRCADDRYRKVVEFAETEAFRMRRKKLPVVNGCSGLSRRAIVVHDSFGQYLKQFISESFGEVVFMPSYDLVGMKSFIKSFDPDLFIDFRVDRRFHLLLQPDPRIEAELGR